MSNRQKSIKKSVAVSLSLLAIYGIICFFLTDVTVVKLFLGAVTLGLLTLTATTFVLYKKEYVGTHTLCVQNIALERENWELKRELTALTIWAKQLSKTAALQATKKSYK